MSELQRWIDRLAQVGATGSGGVYRGSFAPAELEAHAIVAGWMQEAGLRSHRDAIGNLWGCIGGSAAGARAIVTGSHLDSVRNGGNYDGPYGVLGGLMAVKELVREHGTPRLPLEVVAFTGEEASRFPIGLMGSRAVTGVLDFGLLDLNKDDSGLTAAEGMRAIGLDPARAREAQRADIGAFVEMHIEQGPVLETAGIPVAVVQSIVGIQQVRVTVQGRADHAGTTPMHLRKDALLGAARMISRWPELAARAGGVMTSGRISAQPGSSNVVPETVEFSIDMRHHDRDIKHLMLRWAQEVCEEVAAEAGLGLDWRLPSTGSEPIALSDQVQELLRESCREQGIPYLDMPSGAGHDARNLARVCPTGLLFIPCRAGRSHTPDEFATTADMEAGVRALKNALFKLAYQDALGLAT